MNISPEQYQRFLNNECSEEERLLFISYLEKHPEELDRLLQSMGWEAFEEDVHLHPAYTAQMRDRFMSFIWQQQQRRKTMYRWIAAAAVAAAVAVPVMWLFFAAPAKHPEAVAQSTTQAAPNTWSEVSNATDTIQTVVLKDHSKVKLHGHSTLRYNEAFNQLKRDVYLSGIAHFAVAKDARRPFTVYAGGIATTALGTAFRVIAQPTHDKVQVILYEGKVVVRVADTTSKASAKPVYLLPGQELVMNTAGVYQMQQTVAAHKEQDHLKKNSTTEGEGLTFTNVPLEEVLNRLEQRFKTNIDYQRTEINKIIITASFTEEETLSGILNILCTLNNLQYRQTGNDYTISR